MICYRFAAYGTPLRTVPASRPARYSDGDEGEPTQYLSLHPVGPLAELMRGNDLRTAAQIQAVSTRTWAIDVDIDDLPEITFDSASSFGVGADQLVSDDQRACRRLGKRLRRDHTGAIVPSAALPGTRNVVLFGPRVAAPYLIAPLTSLDLPASVTAEGARPLASLADIVCFHGDSHSALTAWDNGSSFLFSEPDWSLDRETVD